MSDAKDLLGSFVWYDQMSNDLAGAERFYSKVVGWTLGPNTMNAQRYTLLQAAGGAAVAGLMPIPAEAQGVPAMWMGYIDVDDVAAYAAKVKAVGGTIHRGPMDIPNVGTFAVAGDPDGAGFMLFKGLGSDAPPHEARALGHVGWRELNAGNGEKAFAFYSGLFGWTKTGSMPMGPSNEYLLFATKSGQEGGVFTKDAETPHPFWRLYFNVEAIDAAIERVKGAGGKVTNGPHEVPGSRWVVHGVDPQGAVFALVAPKR
jgi:predicted enzyme related to lactoylglutathione lyase